MSEAIENAAGAAVPDTTIETGDTAATAGEAVAKTNEIVATIVIPVHNAEAYLPACLDSALSQTEPSIELVCVDNASTDASLQILEQAAQGDARVRVLTESRRGVSFARNAGMAAARGEYLLFLDSDDFIEPDAVEVAVSRARETDAQATIFSFDEYYADGNVHVPRERCPEERLYGRTFSLEDLEGISTELVTPNCVRMAYRTDWLRDTGIEFPTQIKTSEDLVFVNRILFSADRLALVPDCLYHYRRDVQSATRADRGSDGLIALALIAEEAQRRIGERPWLERHLVNIVADTLEYQLSSCANAAEFARLYDGWADTWRPYVMNRRELLAERYGRFLESTSGDAFEALFGFYCTVRDDAERLRAEESRLARELGSEQEQRNAEQARADELASSTSFRVGHAIVSPLARLAGR